MARWEPKTPKESLEASLARLKKRHKAKQDEAKEIEAQIKQVEQAIKALG
jgi:septal ring factor EnvC (AmiA/AmiB activator)